MGNNTHYKAVPVAADSTVIIRGTHIGGFIPVTTGTWTFTLELQNGQTVTLPGIPVTSATQGMLHELKILAGMTGRSSVTTSSGGAGILLET